MSDECKEDSKIKIGEMDPRCKFVIQCDLCKQTLKYDDLMFPHEKLGWVTSETRPSCTLCPKCNENKRGNPKTIGIFWD